MAAPDPWKPIAGVARVVAAGPYDGDIRHLVLALKLRGRRDAAVPLIDVLVAAIRREGVLGDLVTWVPGTSRGIVARGYDHAELIARGVAGRCGLEVKGLLHRATGLDQAGLGRRARFENLKGAISSRPCLGRRVVLVDDVVTTGATAQACASALVSSGAESVEVVTASRA